MIEHLRGQSTYRQQQAKRLADLARSDAGRADALEESLIFVLTQLQPGVTRFSFPDHELSSRKSQAVVIDDEQALDSEWLTFSTTSKPDKNAIKEALKAGRQVTGAQLLNRRCSGGPFLADSISLLSSSRSIASHRHDSRRSFRQWVQHQQSSRGSSFGPAAALRSGGDPLR